jgi:hypothetical protein
MIKFHKKSRLDDKPNKDIFMYALQALVNCKHPKSGENVEQLLGEIEAMVSDFLDSGLNARMFTTAMRAYYATHGIVEGQAPSDIHSWLLLIDAHAISGSEEAGRNAQKILHQMKQTSILPNAMCYLVTIQALVNCKDSDGAGALLKEMFQDYVGGNTNAAPDVVSIGTVLNAHAKSSQKGSASKKGRGFVGSHDQTAQ